MGADRNHAVSAEASLVSVIIPAYNAERFLGRAMRSALAQTYPHLELIVVDDGSTDGTAETIRSFRDSRVQHLSQMNRGQGAARNHGIRESHGRYVTFLDADDVYLPQKVQRQVEFLEANRKYHIAYCNALHFYSRRPGALYLRKASHASGDIFRDLLRASLINPNTMMVVGDILRDGVWFREDRYYPEEWDLCLRLARAGHQVGHQDEPLVVVEIREDSNTVMAVQWTLKRQALEMFERLFAEMTPEEQGAYGADQILRSCRIKLAWSALVSPDPAGAFSAAAGGVRPLAGTVVRAALRIFPPAAVRAVAGYAWRLRQRLSFARVRVPVAERAWAQLRAAPDERC